MIPVIALKRQTLCMHGLILTTVAYCFRYADSASFKDNPVSWAITPHYPTVRWSHVTIVIVLEECSLDPEKVICFKP